MATLQHQPSPAAAAAAPSMTTDGCGRRELDLYEKLEKVGDGTTYGKVYRAREKATGRIVVLKKTRLPKDDGIPAAVLREVSLLRALSQSQDPHVVRLLDLKQGVNREGQTVLCLVFEYMDTDLKEFIRGYCGSSRQKIPAATVKMLMYQLCKGVAFVHGRGVLHRDLKPRNLLMDSKTMALKIADLGLGRAIVFPGQTQTCTHEVGLEPRGWYRAPEILLGATHYYMPADIWSVGCIFAELVTCQPLFAGDSDFQQLLHIFKLLGTPNEQVWPGVGNLPDWHEYPQWKPTNLPTLVPGLNDDGYDLLEKMLEYKPEKRITAQKALEHPYFNDVNSVAEPAVNPREGPIARLYEQLACGCRAMAALVSNRA